MNADQAVVFGLWMLILGLATTTAMGSIWWGFDESWVRPAVVVLIPFTGWTVVLHCRLYAVRMCSVVRAAAGIESPDARELRAVP